MSHPSAITVLTVAASALRRLPLVGAVRRCGYQSLEAGGADEALALCAARAAHRPLAIRPRDPVHRISEDNPAALGLLA